MDIRGVPFGLLWLLTGYSCALGGKVNKHKPWIETSYHGVITENMDTVLLDPPLVALDKDAPVAYAGFDHQVVQQDLTAVQ
ncbi:calsyntenin-2-like, partial [Fundulus heteroclitus]|uniref:calsyntenin-2-like n=1 Tax=Fundulus heteroclitus TaxID=8078 RepID=UPI00165AC911